MLFIIGLCTDYREVKASIILAGDPKQLDAVTMSKYARNLGFKTSFMEFLLKKTSYQRGVTGKYDPYCIVQLTKNYRSHPAILHTSNSLFYDGVLEAEAIGIFSSISEMIFVISLWLLCVFFRNFKLVHWNRNSSQRSNSHYIRKCERKMPAIKLQLL